jgi:hypothetical protein
MCSSPHLTSKQGHSQSRSALRPIPAAGVIAIQPYSPKLSLIFASRALGRALRVRLIPMPESACSADGHVRRLHYTNESLRHWFAHLRVVEEDLY